ncbi:neprosin family prolyl endopeptidase [Paractinoplanes maris]|uniref:neprosin family prolyl endopeptidase n=1 Tax=Paractinoplanes maris TaxID=1734446 RepID=UPI0020216A50|nr:neprosin family prolyl endopeptidase [Actinoplanes maris]
MLKSRRGLLAAGLAVAVVGAIGVVSTVNAGADQIAGPPEASSSAAAADDAADAPGDEPAADETPAADVTNFTPPPVLPWGERPRKIKKGRGGASSSTLRAQGLSAAPLDASGSLVPRGRYGPKGRSNGKNDVLHSEMTDAVPPKPLGVKAEDNKVKYFYNVGSQAADTTGIFSNVTIAKPDLYKNDYHSLAEVALQSADKKQIVEIGWTVDRLVNGDDDPHLFVFHWVNDEPTCYNTCGFQQVSTSVKPGDTLTYGVTKKFGIQYFKDAWWVAYDSEWVGYFPEKIWNDQGITFNRSGFVQVFGEVAATRAKPCTAMGNGTIPTDDNAAARMSSVGFVDGPPVSLFMRPTPVSIYNVLPVKDSTRSFRYGGPGETGCKD